MSNLGDSFGTGIVILKNVISGRTTYIPRKNIFTLDSTNIAVGGLEIEKHAEGEIFLSEGILTCGKNIYPFSRIKGIVRGGQINSFEITLEIEEKFKLELEFRISDSEILFKKFNELKSLEINYFEQTLMKDQIEYVKDRLGLHRV